MKREFLFLDGLTKEAPVYLKETPAIGTNVLYNSAIYRVLNLFYEMESRKIVICLIPEYER